MLGATLRSKPTVSIFTELTFWQGQRVRNTTTQYSLCLLKEWRAWDKDVEQVGQSGLQDG